MLHKGVGTAGASQAPFQEEAPGVVNHNIFTASRDGQGEHVAVQMFDAVAFDVSFAPVQVRGRAGTMLERLGGLNLGQVCVRVSVFVCSFVCVCVAPSTLVMAASAPARSSWLNQSSSVFSTSLCVRVLSVCVRVRIRFWVCVECKRGFE